MNEEKTSVSKSIKNFLIMLLAVVIVVGIYTILGEDSSTIEYSSNTSTSLVDLPERSFSQLTPASIKEDAFIPEATELYSYVDLEFKLPDTYLKDIEETTTDSLVYSTGVENNQQYTFIIQVADATGFTIEDYLKKGKSTLENSEEFNTEVLGNYIAEKINGIDWYYYKLKLATKDNNQREYSELYLTKYNDKIYEVIFNIVRNDGVEPNVDDVRNFGNIKNSLRFK